MKNTTHLHNHGDTHHYMMANRSRDALDAVYQLKEMAARLLGGGPRSFKASLKAMRLRYHPDTATGPTLTDYRGGPIWETVCRLQASTVRHILGVEVDSDTLETGGSVHVLLGCYASDGTFGFKDVVVPVSARMPLPSRIHLNAAGDTTPCGDVLPIEVELVDKCCAACPGATPAFRAVDSGSTYDFSVTVNVGTPEELFSGFEVVAHSMCIGTVHAHTGPFPTLRAMPIIYPGAGAMDGGGARGNLRIYVTNINGIVLPGL